MVALYPTSVWPNFVSTSRRYPTQALKVLRESRDVAADEEKQKYVSLFDNKFTSLVPLKSTYFMR